MLSASTVSFGTCSVVNASIQTINVSMLSGYTISLDSCSIINASIQTIHA